ncbi:Formate/nitrite transporter [Exidia glandulosa HHB12029]|uniref:Formate/nitrite transporter n=1 Tax=Exidia glandulosa HHB12029 TaxID=1314781 RepID=A0A165CUP5_EXIGL|nr:Formate/nitrite transporter [Exidia glandulosa HHB12029]
MLSGLILEDAVLHNATKKGSNPIDKTFFLGVLAGLWVAVSGTTALSAAGGIPVDIQQRWPILPKIGLATFFPFALHLIVLYGGELFTGNTFILAVGAYNRSVPLPRILLNLIVVYIGNFIGCVLGGYLFAFIPGLFEADPYLTYVRYVAVSKTHHGWGNLFLRAIPANTLVCMAVTMGIASREAAGKIMALWFPVVLFVICGYEHSVANMYFINIGLMYGAETSVGRMWFNQSAVVLGNFVGGAIVMGATEHLMNHWKTVLPWERGHGVGTLAAHDIESTRNARDAPTRKRRVSYKGEPESVHVSTLPRRATLPV